MKKNRSKKVAGAATKTTLLLLMAMLMVVAFLVLDNQGARIERYQTSFTENLAGAKRLQGEIEQQVNAMADPQTEAGDLGEIAVLKGSIADLQAQLNAEPLPFQLALGNPTRMLSDLAVVMDHITHFEKEAAQLKPYIAPRLADFQAKKGKVLVTDSVSYAAQLAVANSEHAAGIRALLIPTENLSASLAASETALAERSHSLGNRLLGTKIALAAVAILFLLFAMFYIRARVLKPLRKVIEQTHAISEHDLSSKVEIDQPGAIGEMKAGVNRLVDNMRTAAEFAYSVGEGDLDADLDLVLTENAEEPRANLAHALVHMRNRLREFAQDDQKRKWAAEGLGYFVEILRTEHTDLESMGQQIISGLVNYLSANQGALYVLEEGEEDAPATIRGLAAYAWGHPHNLKARFGVDEGLIGAAVNTNRTIYMTDLPDTYAHIRSGLGDAQPTNILITPLRINETVVGAIELASFDILQDFEIEFIKKVGENIATSINGVQTSLKTKQLLIQSQRLASQLTEKEQHVRQNLEQLEATQARMMASQMELDGVLSSIDKSMAMAEFDLNGKLIEANNSFLKLTGYRLSELRGKSHDVLVPDSETSQELARHTWDALKNGKFQRGEFNRQTAKGQEIWIHASYNPILGADAKPQKILLLASDITAQKLSALDFEGQIHAINQTNAVAEFDLEGNFIKVNQLYAALTGYEAADFEGNHHRLVVSDKELNSADYHDRWAQLKLGQVVEGEFQMQTRAGESIWARGSFNPIFDLEGQAIKIVSVSVDITAQKQMEMQIKEQIEQMAAQEEELRQNMEEMQATHEEMDRNQMEMSGILSSIDKSMAMIEYDMDGNTLTVNNSFLELTGYTSEELAGRHHSAFLPEEERDTPESQRFWAALRKGEFERGNFKRIGKFGKEIWLNSVYNPIPGRNGLPYKIVQFATDITERMMSSLDYEGQLNAINKSNLTVAFDMDGKIIEANPLFLQLTGQTQMSLAGKMHASLRIETDIKNGNHAALWERLKAGEFVSGEFRIQNELGETKWLRGSYNPILDLNGAPFKVVWVTVEISEEKEMANRIQEQFGEMEKQEEELRKNFNEMQETKKLLEQRELEMSGQLNAIDSTLATVEYSPEGKILAANDIFLTITKYTEAEVLGQSHSMFVYEDRAESLEYKQIWRNLQRGISQSGEYKYLTSEGKEIWFFSTVTPVLGRDGKPFKLIQLATEITERKLMSVDFEGQVAAINRSNAVAEFSLEGKLLEANESFLKMVRAKLKDIRQKDYLDFVTEEGKAQAQEVWEELAAGNFVEGEYEWATDRELPLWVKGTFNPILDLDGGLLKIVLIANDITHQKMLQLENTSQLNMLAAKEMESRKNLKKMAEAQEQLSRNEAEIRGQLNAIDATNAKVEFNLDGEIISANEMFLQITGYSAEEILQQSHKMLMYEAEEGNEFWEQLIAGESIADEFRYKNSAGEELWVQATFTPILDKDGQPYKILSLAADITERKLSEAKIVEANEKLNLTLHELTSAQDRLIVSEKMASLGQLVAGVAHEINTPISAVKASVRNMSRILPNALRELPGLLANVPPELSSIFTELVDKSMSTDITLTTKEERVYKKEIQRYLDDLGIENSYEIASSLVSIRVLDETERFLPLIEQEEAAVYLNMAYRLGQLKVNMDNIDTAAEKTTKIVFALKSYTHVQSTDQFVMTNLSENLDLILTVYQNQLKYGVEITRNYEEIPQVPVFPDELGQVWTNIIHNAIQAMKNEGKLTLDILKENEFAVVRISDSGPGIPENIKERIFEPFFTTKAQGEGTGLGLDICAKIVEKHGGSIAVDSEPGRTTFIVHLPFEQPEPTENPETEVVALNGSNEGEAFAEKVQDKLMQVG